MLGHTALLCLEAVAASAGVLLGPGVTAAAEVKKSRPRGRPLCCSHCVCMIGASFLLFSLLPLSPRLVRELLISSLMSVASCCGLFLWLHHRLRLSLLVLPGSFSAMSGLLTLLLDLVTLAAAPVRPYGTPLRGEGNPGGGGGGGA